MIFLVFCIIRLVFLLLLCRKNIVTTHLIQRKQMKNLKIMLGVTGTLLVILGVLCICNPGATLLSMAALIGILTLVSGISSIVFAIRTREFLPNTGIMIFRSLLLLVIGVLFLIDIPGLALSLPFVFAFWILAEGLSLAIQSFDFKKAGYSYWWLMLCLGICGVIGSICSFYHPVATGITMSVMLGLGIIANGINRFVALVGLNRFGKRVEEIRQAIC